MVTEAAWFNEPATGLFLLQMRFTAPARLEDLRQGMAPLVADLRAGSWKPAQAGRRMRTVILVSRHGHCLNGLLFRHASGLLSLDIRAIISNHREFERLAGGYVIDSTTWR
jgi:formyltetrahydrofolate deformylase